MPSEKFNTIENNQYFPFFKRLLKNFPISGKAVRQTSPMDSGGSCADPPAEKTNTAQDNG